MPSPFPGMNPYLEQDNVWHDFHERSLPAIAAHLSAQVRHNYFTKIDEHVYVHELPEEPRRLPGRGDVTVGRTPEHEGDPPGVALLEAPVQVQILIPDVERWAFVEVRDRRSRELVTVIELLSPSNKRPGPDREQYLAKRAQLLGSRAHLVEIDMLRGGRPAPLEDRPESAYSVLVSQVDDRPRAGFWPIGLRDRLPTVPIPLRPPDAPARLDLQAVLHHVYDESEYENYIYSGAPDPPLGPDDAAWAAPFVPPRRG